MITLCRSGCCPQLILSEDGKVGAIVANRVKDNVSVEDGTVVIRFTREQLQVLLGELSKAGIAPMF